MDAAYTPEAFAPSNGITLCYDTFGSPSAPPLLLIMGLGAQMLLWDDDFCAQLAERGFYVIRFDNRDIGRSTYLAGEAKIDLAAFAMLQMQGKPIPSIYKLRDMAADTAGLLDHLGLESAHVAGASMGGMIGQELAVHFPGRVRSLVSIMSSTGNPALPGPTPEAAAVLLAPPPVGRQGYIDAFCRNWKVLRAGAFAADEARDPIRAARMYDRGTNPPGVARQLLAIFASGNRTAGLATIKAPTLVIHGIPDPLVRIEAGRATAAAIPGAKMLEVERMGHALPLELWPQIIEAVAAHCTG
jgi:pimeloyl-ACP methyl ester carboxylesterase